MSAAPADGDGGDGTARESVDSLARAEQALEAPRLEGLRLERVRAEAEAERQRAVREQIAAAQAARVEHERQLAVRLDESQFAALQRDDMDDLVALLQGGSNPNHAGKFARTPVHAAVLLDRPLLLQVLLEHRGDPAAEDIYAQTPLSLAVKYNRQRCFDMLARASKGAGRYVYQRELERKVAGHAAEVAARQQALQEERDRILWAEAQSKMRRNQLKASVVQRRPAAEVEAVEGDMEVVVED